MKRLTFGQEARELAADGARIAEEVMLLLARSSAAGKPRVFECKTCKRRFPSFQALGGHRASHKRPRGGAAAAAADAQAPASAAKAPRTHGCAVCGVEFALGQALGGHMRRHRVAGGGVEAEEGDAGHGPRGERMPGEARGLPGLDLNSAASVSEDSTGLGALVDCMQLPLG